ncbi:tripartite motif-containing protein 2 isoform X2 [Octopus bimaculoides]|uniref:RING-type domain-containing protein n=1 Tax=Octopus bimaculoides TaxID=37653 RepID=A0A0L8I034_OCTBM|nr:tripartite motif-containing protein 2 isoform X2 [Octopus bimaculoides]|eukprot:XP_014767947.1 PREDICTED: tripartite motif-containing protein 2-like isoform X2 [Octopus bimaculoides]
MRPNYRMKHHNKVTLPEGTPPFNMANSSPVVQQIHREFLSCGICLDRYQNPKVLPCLHTFCEHCLISYIPPESLSLTCPICRQQSILPVEGVSAMQTNFFITNLMDVLGQTNVCTACVDNTKATCKCTNCDNFLCQRCSESSCGGQASRDQGSETPNEMATSVHNIIRLSELALTEDKENRLVCPSHEGRSLQFYCCACETAACEECTAVHVGHKTIPLQDAIKEHKAGLQRLISGARAQIPGIQKSVKEVEEVSEKLNHKLREAEDEIVSAFDVLDKLIVQQKTTLLKELSEVHTSKQMVLSKQKETLESTLSRISNCCEVTEEALTHGKETAILVVKKEVTEKLQELGSMSINYQPEENEFLEFDSSCFQSLKKSIVNLGHILTNSAVGYETTATGNGLKYSYIGKYSTVSVTTKDRKGELVKLGNATVEAELLSLNKDIIVEPHITDHKNGTYDITYSIPKEGTYEMFIKVFNQPIKGSPFKVKALPAGEESDLLGASTRIPKTSAVKQRGTKRPSSSRSHGSNRKSNVIEDDLILKVGVKGRNKGEFTNPQGLTSINGKILVADSNNQVVQVFSSLGDCKLRFGSPGRGPGKMQRPTGLAVTMNGNYLVADYDNKWVSVFSPDGKYINKIGNNKLLGPKGVAVDKNGHIIVVDNKASCIFIFQSNGKLIQKFGSRGNDDNQFAGPHYVAINANNDIIVSDFHNHCVKIFNSEGNFLYSFGSNGEGNGQFNAPTGVAVDSHGNILVADWGNSRIQVFDSEGSFLSYVNTSADPLYGPQGLTVTSDGFCAVADSGNHCFKIYKYLQ